MRPLDSIYLEVPKSYSRWFNTYPHPNPDPCYSGKVYMNIFEIDPSTISRMPPVDCNRVLDFLMNHDKKSATSIGLNGTEYGAEIGFPATVALNARCRSDQQDAFAKIVGTNPVPIVNELRQYTFSFFNDDNLPLVIRYAIPLLRTKNTYDQGHAACALSAAIHYNLKTKYGKPGVRQSSATGESLAAESKSLAQAVPPIGGTDAEQAYLAGSLWAVSFCGSLLYTEHGCKHDGQARGWFEEGVKAPLTLGAAVASGFAGPAHPVAAALLGPVVETIAKLTIVPIARAIWAETDWLKRIEMAARDTMLEIDRHMLIEEYAEMRGSMRFFQSGMEQIFAAVKLTRNSYENLNRAPGVIIDTINTHPSLREFMNNIFGLKQAISGN